MPNDMSEADLEQTFVQRVQEGNCDAFGGLIDLHAGRLRRFLALRAPASHLVDEISHDAFVFAYRHIQEFRRGTSFFHWLKAIAWNLLRCETQRFNRERAHQRSYGRRFLRRAEVPRSDPAPGTPLDRLEACLERLPAESREILDLHYRCSLSLKEIAQRLGNSEPGIRTAICRIRRVLKEHLEAGSAQEAADPGT